MKSCFSLSKKKDDAGIYQAPRWCGAPFLCAIQAGPYGAPFTNFLLCALHKDNMIQ